MKDEELEINDTLTGTSLSPWLQHYGIKEDAQTTILSGA